MRHPNVWSLLHSLIYELSSHLYCRAQYPVYHDILDVDAIPNLRSATKRLVLHSQKILLSKKLPSAMGRRLVLAGPLYTNLIFVWSRNDLLFSSSFAINPHYTRNMSISPDLVDLRQFLTCDVQQNCFKARRQI